MCVCVCIFLKSRASVCLSALSVPLEIAGGRSAESSTRARFGSSGNCVFLRGRRPAFTRARKLLPHHRAVDGHKHGAPAVVVLITVPAHWVLDIIITATENRQRLALAITTDAANAPHATPLSKKQRVGESPVLPQNWRGVLRFGRVGHWSGCGGLGGVIFFKKKPRRKKRITSPSPAPTARRLWPSSRRLAVRQTAATMRQTRARRHRRLQDW